MVSLNRTSLQFQVSRGFFNITSDYDAMQTKLPTCLHVWPDICLSQASQEGFHI